MNTVKYKAFAIACAIFLPFAVGVGLQMKAKPHEIALGYLALCVSAFILGELVDPRPRR